MRVGKWLVSIEFDVVSSRADEKSIDGDINEAATLARKQAGELVDIVEKFNKLIESPNADKLKLDVGEVVLDERDKERNLALEKNYLTNESKEDLYQKLLQDYTGQDEKKISNDSDARTRFSVTRDSVHNYIAAFKEAVQDTEKFKSQFGDRDLTEIELKSLNDVAVNSLKDRLVQHNFRR